MKSNDKEFWIFLILVWIGFIVWEFQIQGLSSAIKKEIIRFDLVVLPILFFVTAYTIYTFLNKNKRQ